MSLSRRQVEYLRQRLFFAFLLTAVVGMIVSPPVLSLSLMGLLLIGIFDPLAGINPTWRSNIRPFMAQPLFWSLSGLYLLVVSGVVGTEDWPYFFERLRIKIPLLALPLAFPGWPAGTPTARGRIIGSVVLLIASVLLGVLLYYGYHFAEVNELIRQGKSVPVPRNHIRFSLLVAVATLLSVAALRLRAFGWRQAWWWIGGFLLLGQHLLAVRSGLAGAYGGLLVLLLLVARAEGQWRPLLAGSIGLIGLPVLAYLLLPSFRTKMQYARYELFHLDPQKDSGDYSDVGRLTSIRIGWQVWQDNPLFGVGPGNLRQEMRHRYQAQFPGVDARRPHNQFVSALAASGLFGGLLTLACFMSIARHGWRRQDAIYLALWTVFFLSCLVENTLENTTGVSMFSLFLLLHYGKAAPDP